MSRNEKLDVIFAGDLRDLMVVSYIVLGNNAVTSRFIERTYQLPLHSWSSLYAINQFPGIRAKEIRAIFPRPQNTISRAISLLESRGYVRQEPSAADGREKWIFATAAGLEILAEMTKYARMRQTELFSALSEAERQVFFDLARKIAASSHLLQSAVMNQADA